MSLFLFLLLLFIVCFVLWPILKVWMAIGRAKRQAREYFNGSSGQRTTGYQRGPAQRPQPKRHKKKIDPNVGEYVEFEEVNTYHSSTTETASDGSVRYREESQVEDIEWEDIK